MKVQFVFSTVSLPRPPCGLGLVRISGYFGDQELAGHIARHNWTSARINCPPLETLARETSKRTPQDHPH